MEGQLIKTWHCDDCDEFFYSKVDRQPEFCPYCKSLHLFESKVLKLSLSE